MIHLDHFAPLADQYDGFILDLWGVIHDGVKLYPGAAHCLAELRARHRRIVFLSNAPRRAAPVIAMLAEFGIGEALYDGVITSGEATHAMLERRPDAWWRGLGTRLYHLGPERDRNVFASLGLSVVYAPSEASFVLNTGPDDHASPTDPAAFDAILQACRASRLPMVCANPDLEVIRDGQRVICAGTLAQRYAGLGGEVRSLGKPDKLIYGPTLERLGVAPARVLAVGDALRTDIAGAAAAGLASAWVLGGIHETHLGEDRTRIEAEAATAGLAPIAVLPRFIW